MRACLASYFSAARAPRIARAAARCFDSLRSCSSVLSSSCWIAPRVPTWYCIFVWRCLATAVSVRRSPLLLLVRRPVQPELALRGRLEPVAELHGGGRLHAHAPLLGPDDPPALLRHLHLQHGVPVLRRVPELLHADPHHLHTLLALLRRGLHLHRQPQRPRAAERRP